MPTITNITFSDNSIIVFSTDNTTVTVTNAAGVATIYSVAPVVAPTDTEVDIIRTDGSVQKFVLPTV